MYSVQLSRLKNFVLVFFSLIALAAGATEDPPQTAILKGSQNALNPNTLMTELRDPVLYNSALGAEEEALFRIKSSVYFMLDESDETGTFIQADFTATATVEITYTNLSDQVNVVTIPLTITYKKDGGNSFDRMAHYSFEGAKKINVKLVSVSSAATWDYKKHLILKAEMIPVRDYKFTCANTPQSIQYIAPSMANPDELKITWTSAAADHATENDVEWTWIDKYAIDNYKNGTLWLNDKIFTGNATRVTVDVAKGNYYIPLLYDEGYLFFRVRNVQVKEDGRRVEGNWGYYTAPYQFSGHMAETLPGSTIVNWQATISFAEEGKRKAVVQYADGTLRGRQTVTKDNSVTETVNGVESTGKTVVAETIYDYQGRPAIQILPAPTLSNIIGYTRNFNNLVTGTAIRPVDFDELTTGAMCTQKTPALSTVSGTANYYSPLNPKVNEAENRFIPDAEGYPYTETRYAADGRVAEQGGVGKDYQVGGEHSTKYYYGTPDQKELDALFGTDAGNASHYFKNLVQDANGQFSVSYVDMKGRTVATALAGESPTNLIPLTGSSVTRSLTYNLLNESTNIIRGNTIESVKTLVVSKAGLHSFSYSLSGLSLSLQNCNAQNICYDCAYDLEITIVGDCGAPIVRTFPHVSIPTPSQACAAPASINVSFNETLEEGSYTITKRLTVSKDVMESHRAAYLLNNTCKTLQEFTNYYTTLFTQQIGNCRPTCAECQQQIPATYEAFRTTFMTQTGISATDMAVIEAELKQTYTSLKAQCEATCNGTEYIGDPLADIRRQMMEDMRPGTGQYGVFLDQDGNDISAKPYNIFNNTLTNGQRFRKPLRDGRYSDFYKDEAGNTDQIHGSLGTISNTDFSNAFEDRWLENLLPYHPEYLLLRNAEMKSGMRESLKQDEYFRGIEKYSVAQTAFQARPLNVDQFFNTVAPALKETMRQMVEVLDGDPINYGNDVLYSHNLWQKAWVLELCNKNGVFDYTCVGNAPAFPPASAGSCPGDIDAVWQRFIQLYLQRKSDIVSCYLNPACSTYAYHVPQQLLGDDFTEPAPEAKTLIQQGYQPHFYKTEEVLNNNPDLSFYMINAGNSTQINNQVGYQISGNYAENCENYRDAWMTQLQQCPDIQNMAEPAKTTLLNKITLRLKDLCIQYSNPEHPLGSSTGPGGTPSFQQIIREELLLAGIPLNAGCHPYLVDFPPAYDNYPVLVSDDIITGTPDNCFCTKLSAIQSERLSSGFSGTLLQFIEYRYGTIMRQTHLDSLLNACAGLYTTCKYLPNPISIPPALSCGVTNQICRSCTDIQTWTTAFTTEFGQGPFSAPSTENQVAYNKAYERFMNSKTGYNKSWNEYLAFISSCASSGTLDCALLQNILQQFYATYGNQLSGTNCRQLFVSFFNNATGLFLTFTDIMTLYQNLCGQLPDVCEPKLDCPTFTVIIDAFYAQYGQEIADGSVDCQNLFTQFFNNWYSPATPYTWAQIVQFYLTVCGKELKVCDRFNCAALQQVLNDYISVHGSTGWLTNPGQCTQLFTNFFNAAMGSNFNYGQLQDMYAKCSIGLSVCTAPDCQTLQALVNNYTNNSMSIVFDPGTCISGFVDHINLNLGMNLTWSQIVSMYMQSCGSAPNVCSDGDCNILSSVVANYLATNPPVFSSEEACWNNFTAYYNAENATTYFPEDLQKVYLTSCGYLPNVCVASAGFSISNAQFTTILNRFAVAHPTPAAEYGDSCQVEFSRFFNALMGVNYTYGNIDLIYQSLNGTPLNVCGGLVAQCLQLQQFKDSFNLAYSAQGLPQTACRDLFTVLYNRRFKPGVYQFWPDIAVIYQNCGQSLNLCPATSVIANATTLNGLVNAFKATNPEPGSNCMQLFTGFYNLYMGTNHTWESLVQLYNSTTGAGPQVCASAGNGATVVIRTIPVPPATTRPPLLCGFSTTLFPEVKVYDTDPCAWITEMALAYAEEKYQLYQDSLKGAFDAAYYQKCMMAAAQESFTVQAPLKEYHYTLYYYDQAGNLLKTVPPAGVNLSKFDDATWSTQVKTAKQNDQPLTVPHNLITQYRYNSLNQVVEQISPDGGLSKFWYDRLGRLVFSQNAKQALLNQYSYTRYDNLGRIEEVGQLTSATAMTQATAQSETATTAWLTAPVNSSKEQITKTVYDLAFTTLCTPAPSVLCQKNLRNRVSYTYVQPSASYSNTGLPYTSATYYSYDIHGNVDVLLQHYNSGVMQTITGNAFKRIEYKYDLISGKVNEVAYQSGNSDQFYHRYSYDAENKLTKVFTSPDRVVWEQEADYSYYRHGPLARVELGQVGVQGVDYAYTLQGWLKMVNSTAVTSAADMGGDGTLSGRKIAADVYGFALHYNSTDHKAINLSKTVVAPVTSTALPAFKDLYNGNIAAMAVTFSHTSFGAAGVGLNQPLLYKYRYDQLNRIKEMDAYSGLNQTTNAWSFGSPLTAYQERVSYDGNGNILTYTRNGDAARTAMDNMTYSYVSGTNKLDKVVDVAADATPANYPNYNDLKTGQATGNYAYDAIGNLIKDASEGISSGGIVWNVYGKIASVTKSGVTTSYTYDASGNRISKTTGSKTTWYVRDASGNVMAVYESGNAAVNGGNLSQIEVHLYGSSRLGMWTPNRNVQVIPSAQNTTMIGATNGVGVTRTYKRGLKFFELSNHLGNVLVTVTDRKVAIQNGTSGTILNYVADVVSGGDYYPFGMQMPGRKYQSVTLSSVEGYRYGFNGKEKDKDINSLTAYDYGFRIYNPAIGKFLSVDPLASIYTDLSPYQFSSDNPILFVDIDGAEGAVRDNFTGEIKPMRGDMSSYFARPLFLYQPSTQQPVSNPPSQEKPIKVPVVQKVSSDYLAHVRTTQVQQTVAKVIIVPKKQSLNPAPRTESVQADTRNYYEKQLAKEFAEQVDRTKFIGQTMQTPEGQGGMGLALIMYSTARTPIGIGENAFGVYNGLREGNYWSAAKNFGFLLLDVSPFIKLPGASAAEAITIRSATGGAVAEMSLVRIISKGEKVEDIVNQAKVLTWQTGNEHALVKLTSGERALVSGGPGGIYFKPDQIKLLFGHTHPTSAPPSDADRSALLNLGQSKQYVLHGGETSVVRPSLE